MEHMNNDKKEQDKLELEKDKYHVMVLKNNLLGTYNGYVGVRKGSRLYGIDYGEIDHMIDVHGGLTYAGESLLEGQEDKDDFWYFGFDTSHAGDVIPNIEEEVTYFIEFISDILGIEIEDKESTFKDKGYVMNEVYKLKEQLQKVEELSIIN